MYPSAHLPPMSQPNPNPAQLYNINPSVHNDTNNTPTGG